MEVRRDRGDGLGKRRLANHRYVRQENVAAGQQRDQAQIHPPILARPANGTAQPPVDILNLRRTLDQPTAPYNTPA